MGWAMRCARARPPMAAADARTKLKRLYPQAQMS
jgi:hypothetical protein